MCTLLHYIIVYTESCKITKITVVLLSVVAIGSLVKLFFFQFETRESNLTGFVDSLSKLIIHFPEYACKFLLIKLLIDRESILVKHLNWLVIIMQFLDQQHWCSLLK